MSGMVSSPHLNCLVETSSPAKRAGNMTSTDQQRWHKVKEQLRNQLGEDVFSSWFGRMELEAVQPRRAMCASPCTQPG